MNELHWQSPPETVSEMKTHIIGALLRATDLSYCTYPCHQGKINHNFNNDALNTLPLFHSNQNTKELLPNHHHLRLC